MQKKFLTTLGSAVLLSTVAGCFGRIDPSAEKEEVLLQPKTRDPSADPKVTDAKAQCQAPNIPAGPTCIVVDDARIRYVPLDGSPIVDGPSLSFSPHVNNASIGLRDGWLYTCTGTVTRIAMGDGYAEPTDVPCESVTADESGIWTLSMYDQRLSRYADHASLLAHSPSATYLAPNASRLATTSKGLLTSWHSTSFLELGEPGAVASRVDLLGYDGWIMGLDRLDDGRFVIGTWFSEGTLRVYGPQGSLERSIPLGGAGRPVNLNGIICGDGASLAAAACSVVAPRKQSTPIPANCGSGGYTSSNYTEATEGPNEVHVIGVNEGQSAPCGGPQCGNRYGVVRVHVKKTDRPVVLVLSSYEPVRWTLDVDPDARIAKIVTQGYYEGGQSVVGAPPNTPIANGTGRTAYGWEPEHNTGGSSFPSYIADIRQREGKESSFQGCYSGDRFEIPFAP